MPTLDVASFVLGGALVLLAGLGGGLTIRELHIPTMHGPMRAASLIFGIALIGTGIWINQRSSAGSVGPTEETFYSPMYRGERLDICFTFADDCGMRAADRWCRAEKHLGMAADFEVDSNLGARGIKTKIIGSDQICSADYCTGYKQIICKK